jgi:hypothetical protein
MTSDRRLLGGALGLALLVAACGGSAAATPSAASQAAAASQAPAASAASQAPADSSSPADSQAAGSSSGPSMPAISLAPGNAGDLEAMIPSTVGSITFQKTSFDGASIPLSGTPFDNSKVDPVLSKYGKTVADLRFAMGISTSATGVTMVYALQLRGVPASEFMTALDSSTTSTDKITLGGKTVYGTTGAGMSSIMYPKDDVVFMVIASDKDVAAIVAALP